MPEPTLFLTTKTHSRLKAAANNFGVRMEALGNTLLILSLCDENKVKQAINLIKTWNIEGQRKMEERGL